MKTLETQRLILWEWRKNNVGDLFDIMNLLSAFHYPDNIKSKRVLEKCGFEYEMTIEQGCKRYDGEVFDAVCYSVLKSNYCSK